MTAVSSGASSLVECQSFYARYSIQGRERQKQLETIEAVYSAVGKSIDVTYADGLSTRQYIRDYSAKPRNLVQHFVRLKRLTKTTKNSAGYREIGAILFEMNDGTYHSFTFTSNKPFGIEPEDSVGFINKGQKVPVHLREHIKKLYFIHTHPEVTLAEKINGSLGDPWFSKDDITAANNYLSALRRILRLPDVSLEAIVLPDCLTCDTLYFSYSPE